MGEKNKNKTLDWLSTLAPKKSTDNTRGAKSYARSMELLSLFVAILHTARYLLALLYISESQTPVLTVDCDDWVNPALTLCHLPNHKRIHTGERMFLGSRHMRPHTGLMGVGNLPFECTTCDCRIIVRPVSTGRYIMDYYHMILLTSWDYSQLSIYLHNASKKY